MRVLKFYKLIIMGFIEKDFFHKPTDEEILKEVKNIFPTFLCENELVTWKIEEHYQPMI